MIRLTSFLVLAVASATGALAQSYWVQSATVTHTGGWPSVNESTLAPPFQSDGYTWTVNSNGGQRNPGGVQADGVHARVDADYYLYSWLVLNGSASVFNKNYTMERENIQVKFKIRYSGPSAPPAPGTPEFSIRCYAEAECHPVSSPWYNHSIATAYYIAPGQTVVQSWFAEAERPGGLELAYPGYTLHRSETGVAPGGWTLISTNLWETEVTAPVPANIDNPDQDLKVYADGVSVIPGSATQAWSYAYSKYEYRVTSLGGISLQAAY